MILQNYRGDVDSEMWAMICHILDVVMRYPAKQGSPALIAAAAMVGHADQMTALQFMSHMLQSVSAVPLTAQVDAKLVEVGRWLAQ